MNIPDDTSSILKNNIFNERFRFSITEHNSQSKIIPFDALVIVDFFCEKYFLAFFFRFSLFFLSALSFVSCLDWLFLCISTPVFGVFLNR